MHLLPGEFTNASMNLREILKRLGMRYTWSYYMNEYYYCATYMICRGVIIPCLFYVFWSCESTGPILLAIYPPHLLQCLYYVSKLPKLWRMRSAEVVKLKKAKLKLKWFEPISAEQAKSAGVANFEAYKT